MVKQSNVFVMILMSILIMAAIPIVIVGSVHFVNNLFRVLYIRWNSMMLNGG